MGFVPYWQLGQVILAAGGFGTFTQPVPPGQELDLYELAFNATGVFQITRIQTSDGRNYTNASSSLGIPSVLLQNTANQFNHIGLFDPPLQVLGNTILYLDFKDTSAAPNTVNFVLRGRLNVAGD
jgi:hypothetical protein